MPTETLATATRVGQQRRPVPSGTRPDAGRAVGATLVGASVHVYLQVHMLLSLPNFSLHRFKMFFSTDQLSYLAIAINVAQGRSGSTEPFTETGVSHYPRLYYIVMGLLSRATGVDTVVMWWLMGLALQFLLACFIGWALWRTTRRWWAAALAPLPFLIGTFAGVQDGSYFAQTQAGAVMWGPFALMFALNGGAAGVALAGCAVLGLVLAGWGGFRRRPTLVAGLVAALVLGVVGNVQTYSFIELCYALAYGVAFYGLQSQRVRRPWLLPMVSAALLATILLAGSALAAILGPLPVFVLGLLPALPGYLVVCRMTSWRLLWVTLVGVLLASPTTISTLSGLADKDPFLVYRQASTGSAGRFSIPFGSFAEHGAVALLLLLILMLAPHPVRILHRAYAGGVASAWVLLSFNDLWGPSQEPYRFWIDQFTLVLVTGFPLLVGVAAQVVGTARSSRAALLAGTAGAGGAAGAAGATHQTRAARHTDRRRRTLVAALTGLSLVIWAGAAVVSAKDWLVFNDKVRDSGLSWWPSPRSAAIADLVARVPADGIVVTDTCTDLLSLKAITGARVATYNYGLAWPERLAEVGQVQQDRLHGRLDSAVALRAGVSYLLTDSRCHLPVGSRGHLRQIHAETYADATGRSATLRLWRIIG